MAAASLLGATHPVAVVLARCETARVRMLVLAGAHVAGLLLWWSSPTVGAALVAGAAAAELVLGCDLFLPHEERRTACREVIAAGAESFALPSVAREWDRLASTRHQEQLSESIVRLATRASVADAMPTTRVPLDANIRREAGGDLAEVGRLLAAHRLSVRAAAIIEQLLCSPGSPLYGTDSDRLRRELARVRYLACGQRIGRGRIVTLRAPARRARGRSRCG